MPDKKKGMDSRMGHEEVQKNNEKQDNDNYLKPNFNAFLDNCHL